MNHTESLMAAPPNTCVWLCYAKNTLLPFSRVRAQDLV